MTYEGGWVQTNTGVYHDDKLIPTDKARGSGLQSVFLVGYRRVRRALLNEVGPVGAHLSRPGSRLSRFCP